MTSSAILAQTEQVLEWHALIACLAQEAASTMGADRCRMLSFVSDLRSARIQQQETTEMLQILEGDHPLQPLLFPDIRNMLTRAEKGGLLEGPDLRDVSIVLGLSQTTKAILQIHGSTSPTIGNRAQSLQDLTRVKHAIDSCIDRHGHLRESASPELYQLTQKSQNLRQSMRRRLEQMLASQQYENLLQGQYFAERENRYVIPVKAERKHDIDGIVHDVSSSGATVFVEPRPLIELNNSIKFADLQIAQEARHLLQDLSSLVSEHAPVIQETLNCLATLDCLMAKARLSMKLHGSPIHLNQEHRIVLHQARHPLLALTKEHVVSNSIRIEGSNKVLVISGPNAGGKTVSLKLVGLIAMMVKVGLHPPCAADSDMAFFERIYADIGDTQDLNKDVSSFSGHILNMIALLHDIKSLRKALTHDSLILLDEVGSSTDPIEGAALAEAFLEHLCGLGCIIVATTHYPTLKTLAFRNSQVRNASQEFDIDSLTPTYRLLDGIPGGSSALEIAGRLGLDPSIIHLARSLIQEQNHNLDHMFHSLHEAHTKLEKEITQTQHLRQEAQRLFDEAQGIRDQLQTQEREDRQRYRKQWQREFSKAQRYLNQLRDELKNDKTLSKVQSIQHTLGDTNQEVLSYLPGHTPVSSSEPPQEGDLVEIDPLGTTGILLESLEGKKQVSVRVGARTIKTAPSALRSAISFPVDTSLPTQHQLRGLQPSPPLGARSDDSASSLVIGPYQHELDLRGIRLEEALEMTVAAMDRALISHAQYLKVIHGHGSGALKSGVRKLCRSSTYIHSFRPGDPGEGGDGVTIIELR
jgi:DNA mismatch repair protein MutS2